MGRSLLLSLVSKKALKCTFQGALNYKFYLCQQSLCFAQLILHLRKTLHETGYYLC